jgi:hypothetical protein
MHCRALAKCSFPGKVCPGKSKGATSWLSQKMVSGQTGHEVAPQMVRAIANCVSALHNQVQAFCRQCRGKADPWDTPRVALLAAGSALGSRASLFCYYLQLWHLVAHVSQPQICALRTGSISLPANMGTQVPSPRYPWVIEFPDDLCMLF